MIVAVSNNKGGVGKTSSTINLAALAAQKYPDQRILIVDVDPQSHVATYLSLREKAEGKCIGNVLRDPKALRANIIKAGNETHDRPNLFVIPSSRELEMATQEIAAIAAIRAGRSGGVNLHTALATALKPIAKQFKVIFIDCPPNLGMLTTAVYNAADHVVVPGAVKWPDYQGTQEHTQQLARLRKEQPKLIRAKLSMVLPTMFDIRIKESKATLLKMLKHWGRNTVADPIPLRNDIQLSTKYGLTLLEYCRHTGKDSAALVAYQKAAGRLFA